jgi:iron complex outermembrane receptor protein
MKTVQLGHLMCAACLLVGPVILASATRAQVTTGALQGGDPNVASADKSTGLEEIVVTARRRDESLERVPLTVTALGADQLSEKSITTEQDLQAAVPGLVVLQTEESNNVSFSIRGQGIDAQSGSRPGVLPYVNDVQINTQTASSFFDLASIQVLKGPQGTLFGRNATGGAVLYTTASPGNSLGGYVTVATGNYGLAQIQGAIDIPIVDDKVLLRVAADAKYQDGYVTNLYDSTRLGTVRDRAVRATLVIKPSDAFQNTTVLHFEQDDGSNISPELYSAYPCGSANHGIPLATTTNCLYSPLLDTFLGHPGLWAAYLAAHPKAPAGGIVAYVAQQQAMGPYTVNLDNPSPHISENYYLSNTSTFEVSSDLQFKNIFGAAHSNSKDSTDLDGSPYTIVEVRNAAGATALSVQETRQLSDEFQVLGKAFNEHLNYIVGDYFGFEQDNDVLPTNVVDLSPIIPATPNVVGSIMDDYTQAIFAQGTYDLSDLTKVHGLNFTLGGRYTWERNTIAQNPESIHFGAPGESQRTTKPSWQVGLEEQLTPELLLYVETRGSFRSGGFNQISPAVAASAAGGGNEFLPETTKDVEVGAKFQGQLFGMTERLNVAAYNQWVDNVQRAVYVVVDGSLGAVTTNVPSAEIRGLEVDAAITPTARLELGGNLSYINAAYTNGHVTLFASKLDFGPYGNAPRWSGSVYGQFDLPVPQTWGKPVLRADAFAQSHEYFSNLSSTVAPDTTLAGYGIVNLRLDWHDFLQPKLTASLYAKNVAGKRYYVGGIALGAGLGFNSVIPGPPQMYGLELNYRF